MLRTCVCLLRRGGASGRKQKRAEKKILELLGQTTQYATTSSAQPLKPPVVAAQAAPQAAVAAPQSANAQSASQKAIQEARLIHAYLGAAQPYNQILKTLEEPDKALYAAATNFRYHSNSVDLLTEHLEHVIERVLLDPDLSAEAVKANASKLLDKISGMEPQFRTSSRK